MKILTEGWGLMLLSSGLHFAYQGVKEKPLQQKGAGGSWVTGEESHPFCDLPLDFPVTYLRCKRIAFLAPMLFFSIIYIESLNKYYF